MMDFHFLRPWWLLMAIPFLMLLWRVWRANPRLDAWQAVCDAHLLACLTHRAGSTTQRRTAWALLFASACFFILSVAGPCWTRYPVPTYQFVQPRVVVLDMSDEMMKNDLSPDRLTRAKFLLHDLFNQTNLGQIGMVVYTGEPFVVSPLTDDAKTIDALLSSLTPDVMPLGGQQLDSALTMAANLIHQAGFQQGQILVLAAAPPSSMATQTAAKLSKEGLTTSVLPVNNEASINPLFNQFARAGKGTVLPFSEGPAAITDWLRSNQSHQQFNLNDQQAVPIWRDEGRWFLIPALLLLLPVFWRGWLQRTGS